MERPDPPRLPDKNSSARQNGRNRHRKQGMGASEGGSGDAKRDTSRHAPLSPLELEIMDLVWDLKECTSAEVISACKKIRSLADTTVRTVLTNIRKKGYLELVPSIDRGHRYRPTRSREEVARETLKIIVKRLFKGRVREAVTLLLSDDLMTARDVEEIRRVVERRKHRLESQT